MTYSKGADMMNNNSFSKMPKDAFDRIAAIMSNPGPNSPSHTTWLIFGAVLMGLLLFFRGKYFWLPHPIGLIMLTNQLIGVYWFSILLGWLSKTVLIKYSSNATYKKVRNLFIGLIIGELIIIFISIMYNIMTDSNIIIHLDRDYGW